MPSCTAEPVSYQDKRRRYRNRHPLDAGKGEIEAFLSRLAIGPNVSVSTQNQTLSAIPFLYRNVLGKGLDRLDDVVRAKKPKRIPVVLTRDEVRAVLAHLHDPSWIAAMIMSTQSPP